MQKEKIKKCPTCGTENSIYTQSCKTCGRRLGEPLLKENMSPSVPSDALSSKGSHFSPMQKVKRRRFILGTALFTLIILVLLVSTFSLRPYTFTISRALPPISRALPNGLGEFKAPNGDMIGVNDGSFAPFDVWRAQSEVTLKQQAAQELQRGDRIGAISSWRSALAIESNDAEALIYLEDLYVLKSGAPYITIVAGVSFVSPGDVSPQSQLQGIYVAQHEHNTNSSGIKLRILIANSGSEATYTTSIAMQIAQIASKDKTIVGVIGWLTSSRSIDAIRILSKARIPLVSPQASSDALTGISPYFFRIVPPNNAQAQAAAQFAEQTLNVKNPVIFLDPNDSYSQDLAHDFEYRLVEAGHSALHEETFITGKTNSFSVIVQNALKYNPDGFYFTSNSTVDIGLFQDALPTQGQFASLPVISANAAYVAHKNSYNRWYFTDFAYPDEWAIIVGKNYPTFFQHYSTDFNPDNQKSGGYYGYTRADDTAILSYDAASVLFASIQRALAHGNMIPTAQDVASGLPQISGNQAFQGISGQIAFGTNHDPIHKAIVFLYISATGYIQLKSVQGCFIVGCS